VSGPSNLPLRPGDLVKIAPKATLDPVTATAPFENYKLAPKRGCIALVVKYDHNRHWVIWDGGLWSVGWWASRRVK
jgi:hypothetical protein